MDKNKINWKYFFLEILTIFIAVSLAFVITKWNDDQKERHSETKTLTEIKNGLQQDLEDLRGNIEGHKQGIRACYYFRDLLEGETVDTDSVSQKYRLLFRDFIAIQNSSGYESLKSKGLEIVQDDSLRFEIISLYDFSYEIIQKLEEEYSEMQFNETYYIRFNDIIAKYFIFDSEGQLTNIKQLVSLSESEQKEILSYLWRIEYNRQYTITYYLEVEKKVMNLIQNIEEKLN